MDKKNKQNKMRVVPPRAHPEDPHWDTENYVPCPLSRPDRLMGMCKFGSVYNGETTCHMTHTDSIGTNIKKLQICPMRERAYEAIKKRKEMKRMHDALQALADIEEETPFG